MGKGGERKWDSRHERRRQENGMDGASPLKGGSKNLITVIIIIFINNNRSYIKEGIKREVKVGPGMKKTGVDFERHEIND